jgi:hypothetical protein
MISSEVERTLVKSPPELWAELSDPASLSRHLGELGEIHIVRTEPESTVEWTAENTSGTVSIKASGWGTKVKLSVSRELDTVASAPGPASDTEATVQAGAASEDDDALQTEADTEPASLAEPEVTPDENTAPELTPAPEPALTPAPQPEAILTPERETSAQPSTDALPQAEPEPEVADEPAEPEPRRGFFARLFGRRRARAHERESADAHTTTPSEPSTPSEPAYAQEPPATEPAQPRERIARADEPTDAFTAVRLALTPETVAAANVFATSPKLDRRASAKAPAWQIPTEPPAAATELAQTVAADAPEPVQKQAEDLAAELLKAEEAASAEVTAVLTAVLDRLGAAHHRPFSRA